MQQDKDAGVLYTATEDAFLTYPFENPFPEPLLSKSDDAFIRPTHTSAPSALHKSTSCTTLNTNLFWGDPHASLYPPVATLSISTSTPRPLTKLSKMLLFHPSIKAPAYAKRLEGVRNITIMYNPRSGNKRGEKVMQQAVSKFKAHGLQVNTVELFKRHPGHATKICLARTNFEDIDVMCVVGGDGTFHEVVNGLMQHPISRIAPHTLPALSVIPAGTGNSMVRELQGISSVKISTDEVLFGTTVPIDILKITILSIQSNQPINTVQEYGNDLNEGCDHALSNEEKHLKTIAGKNFVKKEVMHAFNSIHWGLASKVLEKAEELRWMGHGIRYTVAALMQMLQGKSTQARIILEDKDGVVTQYENDTFCMLIANNIGTAGKGMKMAPKAKINDGLIDVLLIRSHKPWHLMKIFERMYSGTHIDLPYVEYKQVRKFSVFPFKNPNQLEVQANPQLAEELVDVDGELKGCTPFECEVIPHALEVII